MRCAIVALAVFAAEVATADTMDVADGFDCLIVPEIVVDLGVEVQGVLDRVLVERGDRVEAGQVVAALRADLERAQLARARDRVAMDSEIGAREADLAFTGQVLARQRALLVDDLTSQQTLDEAEARHRVAEAALERARDNAVLDRHELLQRETELGRRFVTSPIDGVVLRRHADPGELVIDTPVATIASVDRLRVEAVLPASELGRFRIGDVADVFPETSPGRSVEAVVVTVDSVLDTASGTFGVRLELDNADGAVVAGQECRVRPGASRVG